MPKYEYSEGYQNNQLERIYITQEYISGNARAIASIEITKKHPEYKYRDTYAVSIKTDLRPSRGSNWPDTVFYKDSAETKAAQEKLKNEFETVYKNLTNCLIYNGWPSDGNFREGDIKQEDIGKLFTALHFIDPFDCETLGKITAHFRLKLDNLYDVIKGIIERDGDTRRAIRVLSGISQDENLQFYSFAAYFEKEWPNRPEIAIDFYQAIKKESPLYSDAQRKIVYLQCAHSNTQVDSLEKQFTDALETLDADRPELMYLFQQLCGHNPYVEEFESVGANAETIIKLAHVVHALQTEISTLTLEKEKLENRIADDEMQIEATEDTNKKLMESVLSAQSMFKKTLKGLTPETKKAETAEYRR